MQQKCIKKTKTHGGNTDFQNEEIKQPVLGKESSKNWYPR